MVMERERALYHLSLKKEIDKKTPPCVKKELKGNHSRSMEQSLSKQGKCYLK